jgi:SAM-dependent methyltransferase
LYDWRASLPFDAERYRCCVEQDIGNLERLLAGAYVARICDVGSGRGLHSVELLARGYRHLTCIDISSASIKHTKAALPVDSSRGVFTVTGDVRHWGCRGYFDAVLCCLPCIGALGDEGDRQFIKALCGILRVNGAVLLKLFVEEHWRELVGEFAIAYSESADPVQTVVTFSEHTKLLSIAQSTRTSDLFQEHLRLYSKADLVNLVASCGFKEVEVHPEGSPRLPGTITLIARRAN